jgi:hypothetical protein
VSRAAWLVENDCEPTTQAQDCCIEASSIVGPYAYYFGIIDILQEWTWQKKLERFFKSYFLRKDPNGLSAVEPGDYQDRFMARMGAILNCTDEGDSSARFTDGGSSAATDPLIADQSAILLEPAAIVNSRMRGLTDEIELLKQQRRASARNSEKSNHRLSSRAPSMRGQGSSAGNQDPASLGVSGSSAAGLGGDTALNEEGEEDEEDSLRSSMSELEAGGKVPHADFVEALRRSAAIHKGGGGQQHQAGVRGLPPREDAEGGSAQRPAALGPSVSSSIRSSGALRMTTADDTKRAEFTPAGEAFTDV